MFDSITDSPYQEPEDLPSWNDFEAEQDFLENEADNWITDQGEEDSGH